LVDSCDRKNQSILIVVDGNRMFKSPIGRKQFLRRVKILLLILVGLWIGSMGILMGSLYNRVLHLPELVSDPSHLKISVAALEIHDARREVSILRCELAPVLWISSFFDGDLGAIKPLVDVGHQSLNAADEILSALTPALGDFDLSSFSMVQVPMVLDALAEARPAFVRANVHVDYAADAIMQIKRPLSPRLDGWVSKADHMVKMAQYGMAGAQIMPGILGQESSRTYLLLLQNSDELRPTGGFISAVGRLQVDHGELLSMDVEDSYTIDDFAHTYPDPPQPLLDYMGSEQWVLRDVNWSPDFPTTALDAIKLYQISRPEHVDGVVSLNLKGVGMLVAGLEPLDVQALPDPVTSENIIHLLQESWNPPEGFNNSSEEWWAWYLSRKQSIKSIMVAAMDKIISGDANWLQLGYGIIEALDERLFDGCGR
jgi:hypothetical protein